MLMLDDNVNEHPKIEALSDRAFRGWHRALGWSARLQTDGRIPAHMPKTWQLRPTHVEELVAIGLWDRNGDGGLVIHDYHDWQPPSDPVERERWLARRRQYRRRHGNVTPDVTPTVTENQSGA